MAYNKKTENDATPFSTKSDSLVEDINTMIQEDCQKGIDDAKVAEEKQLKEYEDKRKRLEDLNTKAETAYTDANTACDIARTALNVAAAAFEGYEFDIPETRTQLSFALLDLSDQIVKDTTAEFIQDLSTTSTTNDWSKLAKELKDALTAAQKTFQTKENTCVKNRKDYFTKNLEFRGWGGEESDFTSKQDEWVGVVQELQAPHTAVCEEEQRIIDEWTGRLDEAKAARDKIGAEIDIYNALQTSFANDDCDSSNFRDQQAVYFKVKADSLKID